MKMKLLYTCHAILLLNCIKHPSLILCGLIGFYFQAHEVK